MAWLAVDENGEEWVYEEKPVRGNTYFSVPSRDSWEDSDYIELPKGSIKKLIGRELSWSDSPVEI